MRPTLIKALYFAALVSVAWSLTLPHDITSLVGRIAVTCLAEYAVVVGIREFRASRSWTSHLSHPDPWVLLGAGLLFRAIADAVNFAGGSSTIRSILGLAMIVVTAWGLLEMLRQRFGDRAHDHVYEAVIAAGTISMAAWVTVIEPTLRTRGLPASSGVPGAIAVTIALMLASLSLHLLASFQGRQAAFTSLAVSQMLPVITALLVFVGDQTNTVGMIQISSVLPTLSAAFLGAGALEPSMALYEEPSGPAGARLGRLRLSVLVMPVVLGPLLLVLILLRVLPLSPIAATCYSCALGLLVVGHLINMVQERASSTHWASHDKLTGLPNRALFRERTAHALDRSRKMGHAVAVMYLDLDRFKHINDSMGHEAGDQLLEQVAKRILSCVDASDMVARLGGDEFAILLTAVDDDRIPRQLARRLLKTFSAPFNLRPRPVFMSPSVGIAVSEGNASLETLLTQADTAMYRAKESGRNNFAVWSHEMNEAARNRLLLETHLHTAIRNNELHVVYQPKVDFATGNVVGVEALLRWQHPKLGAISPGVFIHLAEESGLINQIGEWVLDTACTQARSWYDNGFTELSVAVNLSSRQFQQQNVADMVSRILRQTRLDPQLLELELTESVAMSGEDRTIETLNDLRGMGVKCSIDDFGTGYSNLSYLSRFPIDALKIDKSFIEQIDKSGGDAAIVVAIIAMAHGLNLKVVAEGVETPQQAAFLARHSCDQMQGFLFSKPLPPQEIEGLLMLEHVASGEGRLGAMTTGARRIERSMPPHERLQAPAPPAPPRNLTSNS